MGFAEESWPQLLFDFSKGNLKRLYNILPDLQLSKLPHPRRDLLKKDGYLTINTIMATRGCSNKCKFCSIPIVQSRYYKRPVEDVVDEIKAMNAKRIIFLDPSPTEDPKYIKELYRAIIPLKIKWVGLTTIKIADD